MPLTPEKISALDAHFGLQQTGGLTPDKIAALDAHFGAGQLQPIQQNSQPSVMEDVAKSAGSSLAEGAFSVPLGFGNMGNSFVAGPQLLGRGIAEGVDKLIGVDPQPRGELWQPFYGSSDAVKDLGIDYQPKTGWGAAAQIPAQVGGSLLGAKAIEMGMNTQPNSSTGFFANNRGEPNAPIPTSEELRGISSDKFDQSGAIQSALNPNLANAYADKAAAMTPQTEGGKIVFGEKSPAEKLAGNIQNLRDRPLSLQETQEIDSRLGQLAEDNFDKVKGDYNSEGTKYLELQHHLRDTWANASENDVIGGKDAYNNVTEARDLWSAQSRMADIERLQKRADLSDNPQTIIKNGAKRILMNPRGYTDEEISALQQAAKSGVVGGLLKAASSKFVDSLVGSVAGGFGGGYPGAIAGGAAGAAVGRAASAFGNKLQGGKLTDVRNAIAQRPAVRKAIP